MQHAVWFVHAHICVRVFRSGLYRRRLRRHGLMLVCLCPLYLHRASGKENTVYQVRMKSVGHISMIR